MARLVKWPETVSHRRPQPLSTCGIIPLALANAREYFADCFAFYVVNSGNRQRMERFRNAASQTWAYLERLAANGWRG